MTFLTPSRGLYSSGPMGVYNRKWLWPRIIYLKARNQDKEVGPGTLYQGFPGKLRLWRPLWRRNSPFGLVYKSQVVEASSGLMGIGYRTENGREMGLTFFQSLKEALSSLKEDELLYINSRSIISPLSIVYKKDASSGKYVRVGVESDKLKLKGLKYREIGPSGEPEYYYEKYGKAIEITSLPTFFFLKTDSINSLLLGVIEAVEVNKKSFDKEFGESVLSSFRKLVTRKPFLSLRDSKSGWYSPEVYEIAEKASEILIESFNGLPQTNNIKIQLGESSPLFKEVLRHIRSMFYNFTGTLSIDSHELMFFDEFLGEKGYVWGSSWVSNESVEGIDEKNPRLSSTVERILRERNIEDFEELEEKEILKLLPKLIFTLNIEHEEISSRMAENVEREDLILVPLDLNKDKDGATRLELLVTFKKKIKDISLSVHIVENKQNIFLYGGKKIRSITKHIDDTSKGEPLALLRVFKNKEGDDDSKKVLVGAKTKVEIEIELDGGMEKEGHIIGTENQPKAEPGLIKILKDVEREFSYHFLFPEGMPVPIYQRGEKEEIRYNPSK